VTTLVVHGLPGPEPVQEFQVLVEHLAADAVVGLLAHVLPLERHRPGAHPEGQPATAEPVQRRRLPCHDDRTAAGERGDEGAQPDRRRCAGRRGEGDPRIDGLDGAGLEGEEVVPQEEAVPAGPLRRDRPVGDDDGVDTSAEAGQ
jgi:hypothetical protein